MNPNHWYNIGLQRGQRGCHSPTGTLHFPDASGKQAARQGHQHGQRQAQTTAHRPTGTTAEH